MLTALKDASRGQWPKQCCKKTYSFCWTNRGTAALWRREGHELSLAQRCVAAHRCQPWPVNKSVLPVGNTEHSSEVQSVFSPVLQKKPKVKNTVYKLSLKSDCGTSLSPD